MAATSNLGVQSPSDGGAASTVNSPKNSRRTSPPWAQIVVRGVESESVASIPAPASALSSGVVQERVASPSPDWLPSFEVAVAAAAPVALDDSVVEPEGAENGGGGNAAKKPAWNMPSNGVVEVSPAIDAVSWPALGEFTKASPKSASTDSLKTLSNAALPTLQVTRNSSPSSLKQVIPNNGNPNSNPNHVAPTRQRSMKQRGGGNSSGSVAGNGGFSQSPAPPQDSGVEMPPNTPGKPATGTAESSPREHTHKESPRGGFGSQSPSGNEQQHHRNTFKRGNGGPHPRGDGSYHHSYGGKRDQDRGNQEWNPHNRSFGSRDAHLQPQRGFPRFIRPSAHTPTPFIPPQPMPMPLRPFGNPMVYPDVTSPVIYVQTPAPPPPESLRPMPMVGPMPPYPMFISVPDPQLHAKIVNQIDYYFSNENLIKDTYLRQNMDDQGWVPINLIASFKKVKSLVEYVPLILDAVRTSTVLEVQGDKVRRRNDWMKWIMPPPVQFSNVSSPLAGGMPSHDMLVTNLQHVALDEKTTNQGHVENFFSRSSSREFNGQILQSGGEGPGQVSSHAGFERPTKA